MNDPIALFGCILSHFLWGKICTSTWRNRISLKNSSSSDASVCPFPIVTAYSESKSLPQSLGSVTGCTNSLNSMGWLSSNRAETRKGPWKINISWIFFEFVPFPLIWTRKSSHFRRKCQMCHHKMALLTNITVHNKVFRLNLTIWMNKMSFDWNVCHVITVHVNLEMCRFLPKSVHTVSSRYNPPRVEFLRTIR